jgi:hypothetical protein
MSTRNPSSSPALERFYASMEIDFYNWHDGIGYDLEALTELSPAEFAEVEALLLLRKDTDWRDAEALAALGSDAAIAALKECLSSQNIEVRLEAARQLMKSGRVSSITRVIVETLPQTTIGSGLGQALILAKQYPDPEVIQALFYCTLHGNNDIRIHCAGLLYHLFGKSPCDYDFSQSELFFKFQSEDLAERKMAFAELCWLLAEESPLK